jgi:hypothetical protein
VSIIDPTRKERPPSRHFAFLLGGAVLAALIDVVAFEPPSDLFVLSARVVGAGVGFFVIPAIVMFFSRLVWVGWITLVLCTGLATLGRLTTPV